MNSTGLSPAIIPSIRHSSRRALRRGRIGGLTSEIYEGQQVQWQHHHQRVLSIPVTTLIMGSLLDRKLKQTALLK